MNSTLPIPRLEPDYALTGKRILVVDDNPSVLMAVSKVLSRKGAAVTSVAGAAEAIQVLAVKKEPFDIILTDLRMPLTSGKLILSLVKSVHPDVPVMIMSAFWTDETKEKCLLLGASKCMSKPLRSQDLLESIAGELCQPPEIDPPS